MRVKDLGVRIRVIHGSFSMNKGTPIYTPAYYNHLQSFF